MNIHFYLNICEVLELELVRNTRKLFKGPDVVVSVVGFGWWTASDVPKELTFQLWLKIGEKYQKLD